MTEPTITDATVCLHDTHQVELAGHRDQRTITDAAVCLHDTGEASPARADSTVELFAPLASLQRTRLPEVRP